MRDGCFMNRDYEWTGRLQYATQMKHTHPTQQINHECYHLGKPLLYAHKRESHVVCGPPPAWQSNWLD
jgi:hypothetical protein